jgi:hypothetical protein
VTEREQQSEERSAQAVLRAFGNVAEALGRVRKRIHGMEIAMWQDAIPPALAIIDDETAKVGGSQIELDDSVLARAARWANRLPGYADGKHDLARAKEALGAKAPTDWTVSVNQFVSAWRNGEWLDE